MISSHRGFGLKLLPLLFTPVFCLAAAEEFPSVHSSTACASVFSALQFLLPMQAEQRARELTGALDDLRSFRRNSVDQLDFPRIRTLRASGLEPSAILNQPAVREQIRGIEISAMSAAEANADSRAIFILRLNGRQSIENFYKTIRITADQIQAEIKAPMQNLWDVKRLSQATGLLLPLGGAAVLGTTEPWSLLRFLLMRDRSTRTTFDRTRAFLEQAQPGAWQYDAWSSRAVNAPLAEFLQIRSLTNFQNTSYQGGQGSVSVIPSSESDAILQQRGMDSRGIIYRINDEIRATQHSDPRAYREAVRHAHQRRWIGMDQLIKVDDAGDPELIFVIRVEKKRPKYTELSHAQNRVLELQSQLD